jgi:hypothetical protein
MIVGTSARMLGVMHRIAPERPALGGSSHVDRRFVVGGEHRGRAIT